MFDTFVIPEPMSSSSTAAVKTYLTVNECDEILIAVATHITHHPKIRIEIPTEEGRPEIQIIVAFKAGRLASSGLLDAKTT